MSASKEQIAAYADGELEGDALREVEAEVLASPELQAQVAAHRRLKARLAAHFQPLAEGPVPDRLIGLVRREPAENVVDLAAARERTRPRPLRFAWAGPALAASLVIAMVGYGMILRSAPDYATGDVAAALDSQLAATQARDAPVRVLLSFRDGDGRFCRGFSSTGQSGVACRDDRGWRLDKVIPGQTPQAGEYRQAGSAEAEVLSAIQELAQGPALNADDERNAMRAGWRRR
jgi:hypothetical protein